MIANGDCIGALNFYAADDLVPGMELQVRAAAIAEHAAGALALAVRLAERDDLISRLRLALSSRSTIDQAIGILMAQQRCSARAAFDLLRTASQGRNLKLRDIAAGIVASVTRDPLRPLLTGSRVRRRSGELAAGNARELVEAEHLDLG